MLGIVLIVLIALFAVTRLLRYHQETQRICADDPSAPVCARGDFARQGSSASVAERRLALPPARSAVMVHTHQGYEYYARERVRASDKALSWFVASRLLRRRSWRERCPARLHSPVFCTRQRHSGTAADEQFADRHKTVARLTTVAVVASE